MSGFQDLVTKYNNNTSLNLIIKLYDYSKEEFFNLLQQYKSSEITVLKSVTANFKNQKLILQCGKKRLFNHKLIHMYENRLLGSKYRVTLTEISEQTDSSKFNFTSPDILVKVKLENVITLDSNWKMKLSTICTTKGNNKSELKEICRKLLNENDIVGDCYRYDIEFEYIGSDYLRESVIESVLEKHITLLKPSAMNTQEYQKYVETLVGIIQPPRRIHQPTLKKILPSVVTLTKEQYKLMYPITDYYATIKADGNRAICIIEPTQIHILSGSNHYECHSAETAIQCIVDVEMMGTDLYIFDVIKYNDEDTYTKTYGDRIAHISDIVANVRSPTIKFRSKSILRIEDVYQLESLVEEQIQNDGIIFIENTSSYTETRSFKWKNIHHNSIDFLVKKVPNKENKYYLFVGISKKVFSSLNLTQVPDYDIIFPEVNEHYFPIQFCPSHCNQAYVFESKENLDGKIVEMTLEDGYDFQSAPYKYTWKILRVREDRSNEPNYFGNDFRTAETIWMNFVDPFTFIELLEGPHKSYFQKYKDDKYKAMTGFLAFLKSKRFKNYTHYRWMIDLFCGKGQDLIRYTNNNVYNVVAIDKDRSALGEYIKRKLDIAYKKKWSESGTRVHVIPSDIFATDLMKKISSTGLPKTGADGIVCNLGLHYVISSEDDIAKFFRIIDKLLKKNGKFSMMTMIGEKINEKFNQYDINYNESVDWMESDMKKYSLIKMYDYKNLSPAGSKIKVLLPFSNGDYYEEYALNITFIMKYISQNYPKWRIKFIPVVTKLEEFKRNNISQYNNLTDNDKDYLELFGELLLQKY